MIILGPRNRVGPQGLQGEKGKQGKVGPAPEHEWNGTKIRFQNPDGSWGPFVDLKGPKGKPGEKGDPGKNGASQIVSVEVPGSGGGTSTGNIIKKIYETNLSALKMVRMLSNGHVQEADYLNYIDAQSLGMTLQAGVAGFEGDIITFGPVEDMSFNFPLNDPLFLTSNGNISNISPSIGHSSKIGYSLGVGKIFIDIDFIIKL